MYYFFMEKKAVILLMIISFSVLTMGSEADPYVNSTEPKFLRNIGPRDPRTDNPLAAGITVLGVGFFLYLGMRSERKKKELEKRMSGI